MRIDCYVFPGCPSEGDLLHNITRALVLEGLDMPVTCNRIEDTEAARLGIFGSPAVFVNGIQIQPLEGGGFS